VCIKIKMDRVYRDTIESLKQFVDTIIRSTLSNQKKCQIPVEIVEINVGSTDVFNFNMNYEEKVKLYTIGYMT